jgi:single-stranded-DNA-specific exonuclease
MTGRRPEGASRQAPAFQDRVPGRLLSQPPAKLSAMRSLWRVRPPDPAAAALALETGVPEVLASLLIARGATTGGAVRAFLRPDPAALHDPFRLKGAEEAADVLVRAARSKRRIVVFGDYDVDGVTSVAQLRAALLRAGADAVAFLPHRLRDGYGLRVDTVRRVLRELKPAVLVTVDCGISAVEGVACARAAGVEVVVTDHHLVPEALPAGAVVVNPRQPGCAYPEKELAACGIAMKIAEAVASRAGVRLARESLLRAAALGTIADLVPLTGENRTIAALGLAALANPKSPGLRALLSESGVAPGRAPTSEEVAFRIAPRLNAAGRLDTAWLALSLFEERDPARARAIASELSTQNAQRQAIERRVTAEAREKVARECDLERDAVILLAAAGWHRGVLGIAASRLAREYRRPVLLFSLEDGRARGSGRSIPGVSLHETLKEIEGLFEEFGGHDQAVGASLPESGVEKLREAARALFAARVPAELLAPVDEAEAALPLEDVGAELLLWLERLEPHGMGNPRPIFASRARPAAPFRALGTTGLRGRLESGPGRDLACISWRPDCLEDPAPGVPLDVQFRLRRGRDGAPEAEIVAARPLRAFEASSAAVPA